MDELNQHILINNQNTKERMQKISLLTTLLFICSITAFAQINDGSMPKSFVPAFYLNQTIPVTTMPALDMAVINQENTERDAKGILMFNTKIQPTSIALGTEGVWDKYPNGDQIWRTRIQAKDAKGVVLYFSNFRIPTGAKLYVYSVDKKEVLGGFTSDNNQMSGQFALGPIYSDDVIVEYFEPARVAGQGQFTINGVGNMYRFAKTTENFGDSDPCEVNVNCTPEGTGKTQQRDAVARILVRVGSSAGWCSGAMVNNALQNCDRYFLTALHCALGTQGVNSSIASASDFGQWIFYFNYQSTGCTSPSTQGTLANQSLTGCTMRAHSNGGGGGSGSDFLLLEINNTIPSSYNVFFAGWNAGTAATTGGYGIHHPAGDIKKVSAFSATTATTGWNGSSLSSHWRLSWIATTNGHGVTEGGSSGSPLFNQNQLIIGQLFGGGAACSGTNDNGQEDNYGRLDISWNGTSASERLKDWLDPANTNVLTHLGYNPNGPGVALDAGVAQIAGIEDNYCNVDSFIPELSIRNYGNDTITTLDIVYDIDGTTYPTYSWMGSLAPNTITTVVLPTLTAGAGAHTFNATTILPNGSLDSNLVNDARSVSFFITLGGAAIDYALAMDCYGSEISWTISDSATGLVLYSGGPYNNNFNTVDTLMDQLCLADGCYRYAIYDSYGDGLDGTSGFCGRSGDYWLTDVMGNALVRMTAPNGNFGDSAVHYFCLPYVINNQTNLNKINEFKVFPNPTDGMVYIDLALKESEEIQLELYSVTGQLLQNINKLNIVSARFAFDLKAYSAGMYFVKLRVGDKTYAKKVVKD